MTESSPYRSSQASTAASPKLMPEMELTTASLPNNAIILYDSNTQSTLPSLTELLTSDSVVLNVGPEQTRTTVHRILFRGVSEPLHQLLTSHSYGHVSNINESLRLDDTEAFFQLIRIAYKIASSDRGIFSTPFQSSFNTSSQNSNGHDSFFKTDNPTFKQPKCTSTSCKRGRLVTSLCTSTSCTHCHTSLTEIGLRPFLEAQFKQYSRFHPITTAHSFDISLDCNSPDGKPLRLVHFAKVFVLAQKYKVQDLAASALRGFEKRLKKYAKIHAEGVKGAKHSQDDGEDESEEIYDAFRYLAATARVGTESLLCRCLFRYVISRLDLYLEDDEFKEIMAKNGMLGLELAQVVKETMLACEG